ncbi:MAG: hypothetical protein IJD90_05385 [Clostridia bacterium]|nr:hypothetical protein [Clostridia bacterium]
MNKIIKKRKKIFTTMLSAILILSVFSVTNISVLASTTLYNNISTERIANILDLETSDSIICQTMGGIGVGPQLKRLFVVKSKESQNRALLYYFPNLYNQNDYQVITLKNIAGHANSMAIDYNYIYITRWRDDGTITKQITRISRDKIRDAYLDLKNGVVNSVVFDADDCTIFQPKVKNSDGSYSNFAYAIRTITKYKQDGQFLITYANNQVFKAGQVAYTVANVTDGKFIVSEKKKDIKVIPDSLFNNRTNGQAICYD